MSVGHEGGAARFGAACDHGRPGGRHVPSRGNRSVRRRAGLFCPASDRAAGTSGVAIVLLQHLRPHEFLRSTEDGRLDLEASKRLLVETASASPPSKHYDVLVDTRSAHSEMTVSDLLELASELHNVRKSFAGKTALVVPRPRLDQAEFFVACAEERGFEASAFTSLGDAMSWLIDTPPTVEPVPLGARMSPVGLGAARQSPE